MSTPTEPNMQIITPATRDEVRPGDHVVFLRTWERDGLTVTERREGIAHHLDDGDWCTVAGMYITLGAGESITITIRRLLPELPNEPCAVIVPADGHEYIEATIQGETFYTREAIRSRPGGWYAAWRAGEKPCGFAVPEDITPGTWKVDNQ